MYFSAFKGNAPPVEVRVFYVSIYVEMLVEPKFRTGNKGGVAREPSSSSSPGAAILSCLFLRMHGGELSSLARMILPLCDGAKERHMFCEFMCASYKKHTLHV